MTERGEGTCICERCGNSCHQRQSHCDSCWEVRELRGALERAVKALEDVAKGRPISDAYVLLAATRALEETPW